MRALTRGLAVVLACATSASGHAAAETIFTDGSIVIRDTRTFASLGGIASRRGLYRELGGVLEGGLQLGDSRWYVHGLVAYGRSTTESAAGSFARASGGLEGRACRSLCGFAGLDVGVVHDRVEADDMLASRRGTELLIDPRVGLELGDRLRARLAISIPYAAGELGVQVTLGATLGL